MPILSSSNPRVISLPSASELRRVLGQEPAAAGPDPGGAAEVGEPAGQEDSQEAAGAGAICALLAARLHEGPAQPVREEAQSTAAHQQEQVANQTTGWDDRAASASRASFTKQNRSLSSLI